MTAVGESGPMDDYLVSGLGDRFEHGYLRVRANILLCTLAYYVEWHRREV